MRRGFILFIWLFGVIYALPLQDPIPGIYQCFLSPTDPFDINAQAISATLEFLNPQSYRFTTASATEEGSITTAVFESSEENTDALFQSGSVLSLQPNTSSAAYEGAFFIDYLGEAYVIIANNNNFWIRCQSAGANITASIDAARNRPSTLPEVVTTPTLNELSEPLQPLQPFQVGGYACIYTFDTTHGASGDYPSHYPDDDPTVFYVLMFADGTTLTIGQNDIFKSDYSSGIYSFDAAQNTVHLEGGSLGGLSMSYGTNAEAKTALFYS